MNTRFDELKEILNTILKMDQNEKTRMSAQFRILIEGP